MQQFLADKKVLFITTKYHGYQKEIFKSLKKSGASVDFYYDDPLDYLVVVSPKVVQQITGLKFQRKANDLFRSYLLKKVAGKSFDFVFILKGSMITIPFLISLKQKQPHAVFIQYQWDSIGNYNYLSFIPFFDYNFSFDHKDSLKIDSLVYLPMFARDDFYQLAELRKKTPQNIDVLFVGANHSNRMITLRKLKQILKEYRFTYKFFIHLPLIIGIKGVFISRKMKYDELMLRSVSKTGLMKLLLNSKFVLDLPSPNQSGITPRALEALAAGCMLITSDASIREAPFFDANLIYIIEPDNLKSIPLLLQNPVNSSRADVQSYSLMNWLKNIFDGAKKTAFHRASL